MSYRVRRKFTSSTFQVGDHLCKIFLQPVHEYRSGFWLWNTGFAIGKSQRQLNDWYWRRENKRRRSLDDAFNGRVGIKAIRRGFMRKSFGFVGSLPLATFLLSIALQVLQLSSFLHSAGGEDTIQSGRLTKIGRSSSGTDLLIRTTRSEISSK